MTRHPDTSKKNKNVHPRRRFNWLIGAGIIVLVIIAAFWPRQNTESVSPEQSADLPSPLPVSRDVRPADKPDIPDASLPDDEPAKHAAWTEPASSGAGETAQKPSAEMDTEAEAEAEIDDPPSEEFVPTPEQELHYEKTRMFMAEARESLPLIGIRSFDPIAAGEKAHRSAAANNASGGTAVEQKIQRDNRGLQDGEVWIRINAAYSGEHKEIMAQTADLYRANTGFEGDVTVVVWVGAHPMIRETFGPML